MRGKVIASGTQIIIKEFEMVKMSCVSASSEMIPIRGLAKYQPIYVEMRGNVFAWYRMK